ncbi:hypothetical protein [Geobacter sp. DSM 9736]|uniref:hypothetical protein n=1 Tax=Geobacter sp. DSM 9736 TaxID=1277350 RepID=UPI000B501239|nr:hypothetical protein [Geobacter sp. DSM 9736]SNB45934.1 hypothetical protein SAMN06269301_1368 [Geobacter sp. DSM 9736]
MLDPEVKFMIQDLHTKVAHAYNITYDKLSKANSHDAIENAVKTLKGLRSAPDGVEFSLFAAAKGMYLAHDLAQNLYMLHDFPPESLPTDYVMELLNTAFAAGLLLGSAHHGNYTRIAFERHKPFLDACKRSKKDNLGKVLEDMVVTHLDTSGRFPRFKEIIHELESLAASGHAIIQEVVDDEETVHWVTKKGLEEETSFKGVRNRLSLIKKKYIESR